VNRHYLLFALPPHPVEYADGYVCLRMCGLVDVVHMAHSYESCPESYGHCRIERVKFALSHMGASVLSGTITSLTGSFIMFFCGLHLFSRFGAFFFGCVSHPFSRLHLPMDRQAYFSQRPPQIDGCLFAEDQAASLQTVLQALLLSVACVPAGNHACRTILLAWLWTNLFYMPLLATVGPQHTGAEDEVHYSAMKQHDEAALLGESIEMDSDSSVDESGTSQVAEDQREVADATTGLYDQSIETSASAAPRGYRSPRPGLAAIQGSRGEGADEEEERVINLVDPRGEQIVRSPELQRGRSVVERKKRRPQQQQSTSPSLGSSLSPQGGSSYS
jgi:hypothetical protein